MPEMPASVTDIQACLWPDQNSCDPSTVASLYNDSAKTYETHSLTDGWDSTFTRLQPILNDLLQSGPQVVLDAGCATGLLPKQYVFPGNVELHGIDIAADCLEIAKGSGHYASLQEADLMKTLPFASEHFDVVVCNGVLGYCETNQPLHELLRVLKSNGSLIMSFRNEHFTARKYRELISETPECKIQHEEVFDPYPNNPAYKHDYIVVVVHKAALTSVQANLWPDQNSCDPATVASIYNAAATTYEKEVLDDGFGTSFIRLKPLLDDLIRSGAKVVLDAGCATGILANQYAFPDNVDLHGIDLSVECLEIAKGSGHYSSLQEADLMKTLPFASQQFDVVVCNGVLGYCETNQPLHELLRVLKSNGSLIMSFRNEHFTSKKYRELISQCPECKIQHEDIFDPFPNNPAYKHDYILVVVQKASHGGYPSKLVGA